MSISFVTPNREGIDVIVKDGVVVDGRSMERLELMKHYGSRLALYSVPLTVCCCQSWFRCCALRQLRPMKHFLF